MRLAALSLNDELVRFFEGFPTFESAWSACGRPDWLVELALHAETDRRRLVVRCAPIVQRALELHAMPIDVPVMVRRWARDQAPAAEAWAAGFRVSERAKDHRGPAATALRAASALAFGCDGASSPTFYAIRGHLSDAVALAMQTLPTEAPIFAAAFRSGLPAGEVEGGLRRRIAHAEPPTRRTGETLRQPHSWPPLAAEGD